MRIIEVPMYRERRHAAAQRMAVGDEVVFELMLNREDLVRAYQRVLVAVAALGLESFCLPLLHAGGGAGAYVAGEGPVDRLMPNRRSSRTRTGRKRRGPRA